MLITLNVARQVADQYIVLISRLKNSMQLVYWKAPLKIHWGLNVANLSNRKWRHCLLAQEMQTN
jgi:hypothetical protein